MIKDLTQGKITKTLILFALPMLLGNLIQQIYNIADTIVVGKFISDSALASVGAAFPMFFLLISILIGLSTGASVVISHLFGARNLIAVKKSIYTAIITALVLGILISIIGYLIAGPILSLLQTPEDIFDGGKTYLQVIFLGTTFLFVYNMITSSFNALGDSKTPLFFNVISAILNIGLDLLFIIKFKRGIAGAARATVIARAVAVILSFIVLLHKIKKIQTEKFDKIFDFDLLKNMSEIAIPAMLNQSLVAIGAMAIQSVINGFGSNIIAGYAASSKIDTLAMMPILNLSTALATFVAQNLGAGKIQRVKDGFKSALIISIIFSILMAIIIYFFGIQIMGLFIDKGADPSITQFGKNYMMVVSFGYILMGFLFNSGAVLRAAGAMKPFLFSTFISTLMKVAAAFLLGSILGESVIWWCAIIGRGIGSLISMTAYIRGNWIKLWIKD